MNNIYKKIAKKVGGTRVESLKSKVQSRRGISEVGLPKIDVGLPKSYIKRVGVAGFVVVNVLSLVLAPVAPASHIY